MTRDECRAVQDHLHDDITSHRLVRLTLDLDQLFTNASELSRVYTAKALTRGLDLLKVVDIKSRTRGR